jgi:hypothetical protein
MAIKIGDLIPEECTPVANVPFTLLSGASGTLQVEPDSTEVGKKLPLASERANYEEAFALRSLQICELRGEFAQQGHPLMVDIKALEPGNCYTVKSATDPWGVLSFSAKMPAKKLTRTSDGRLWTAYTLDGNYYGTDSSAVYLAWSTNKGISWQGHLQINTIEGNTWAAAIVSDSNDVIHIVYYQNQFSFSQEYTQSYPWVDNIHYRTYSNGFGPDILVTDQGFQDSKRMNQFDPDIAIDSDNNVHIVWTGSGFMAPDQYGNHGQSLNYSVNPTGGQNVIVLDDTGAGTSGPIRADTASILVDQVDTVHILYNTNLNGADIRYLQFPALSPSTAFENFLGAGRMQNFCLIPSEDELTYEPYLILINQDDTPNTIVEARRTPSGWIVDYFEGFRGDVTDVTGGVDPDTGISSGLWEITSADHGLSDGEYVYSLWAGSYGQTGKRVINKTQNTYQLEGTEQTRNTFTNVGLWLISGRNFSVSRDASGKIHMVFHQTPFGPDEYIGDTYMMIGGPGDWGPRELISEGVFWPNSIQMDNPHSGNYQNGYMFTNSFGTIPISAGSSHFDNVSTFRVCLTLTDPIEE